jgi:hypothetical protein
MTVVNRQFTYRRRIKVSSDDVSAARIGKKTCTIRLGSLNVDGPTMDLTDGKDNVKVRIVSVETEPYQNLNSQHAAWEGFSSIEELQKDLKKYYRIIDAQQPVTVIPFELIK